MMATSLFESEHICLAPLDLEHDPAIEAGWHNDPATMQVLSPRLPHPLNVAQVKKRYEDLEKRMEESGDFYFFAIRSRAADHLLGFTQFDWVGWSHGFTNVQILIGDPAERGKGYGTQALKLMLNYGFNELNLHRIGTSVPAYNEGALRLFERAGFTREVTRRQAFVWQGQRWDLLHLGILRREWEVA
jgi:RimJ/RimL family protein N-acetyltransferase